MALDTDPLIRDKKTNSLNSIPLFFGMLTIANPLWLVILLPTAIISQLIVATGKLFTKKKKSLTSREHEDSQELIKQIKKTSADQNGRKYDLVLFGATGFTGKLAALYLAKQYGSPSSSSNSSSTSPKVKWAIAGRRRDALEKIRQECTMIDKNLASLPLIIADSLDEAAIDAMVAETTVVITTAGPFHQYGTYLVKSCAMHGTHYCDITGESDWVREIIDLYDDVARASGAKIVHQCGHDSIPWDLLALETSKFMKKKGDSMVEISCYDEVNGGPSGGTLATATSLLAAGVRYRSKLGYDPLAKSLRGSDKAPYATKVGMGKGLLYYSNEAKLFTAPFPLAQPNGNAVRRSNALLGYSTKLKYEEVWAAPSFHMAYSYVMSLFLLGTTLAIPPLGYLLTKLSILPAQGQGPSKQQMDAGYLKVTAFGKGAQGMKTRAQIYYPTDAGYRDTARMLVEAGLTLVQQQQQQPAKGAAVIGGVLTPASCQGEALLERLIATGCSFSIEQI